MKRDARTGRHFIIEPNIGRPTGRSPIAERGGVELIMTAYRDALGEPLPTARVQRYRGVKWIYWRHDLQASIVAARHGRLSLRGWWRSVRGPKIEAVGSWRDPVPFLVDGWRTLTAVGGRRRPTCGPPDRPGPIPFAGRPEWPRPATRRQRSPPRRSSAGSSAPSRRSTGIGPTSCRS